MIDYEKLILVHKLYPQGYLKIIPIFDKNGEFEQMNYSMDIDGVIPDYFLNIDDLITKLQSLLKPTPKFKLSDDVWFMHDGLLMCGVVDKINFYNECVIYHVSTIDDGFTMGEGLLFPTRQALIEHQIDYWRNMLGEELEQHVSNYCEPKPDCPKCHNYRNANNKLGYDCLCDELVTENTCDNVGTECQHIPSRKLFLSDGGGFECIKCGEFYR